MEILRGLNHAPVKKLGQNFLIDANIVRKSLELARVSEGDAVVEVGPGLGTLTGALLAAGARVYAAELDRRLFEYLKKQFAGNENFSLINADAVDMPLAALPESEKIFKIVANLPYAISTPWLDKVLCGRLPQKMSLMLQKEAADRFAAAGGSKDFAPISICLDAAYKVSARHRVSASCFHPKPAVDSVLLALELRETPFVFKKSTREIMRYVFSQKRKQIAAIAKGAGGHSEILGAWIEGGAFDARSRPERIGVEHWRALDSMLK